MCVACSIGYQHAIRIRLLYCYLCTVRLYNIFHIISRTAQFWKQFIEHKLCVLIFCTTTVRKISHSKKNWARYDHKCTSVFMKSTLFSYQILTKLEIYRQIFEKYQNTKFHENPSSGSRVVLYGRKDRQRERDGQTWRSW